MKNILYNIKLNKKKITIIASIIVLVLITTFGLTYAYFGLNIDASQVTDINAVVGDVEQFTFASGDELTLSSVSVGQSGTTNPSATLISGVTGQTIDSTYDMYIDINTNSFVYTEDGEAKPELLLKVVDSDGNEITEADGLTYVNIEGNTGFDVTNITGFFPLVINHPISTSDNVNGTTQTWDVTLTFADLTIDQSHNNGKSFTGSIILKNGMIKTLPELIFEDNGGKEVIEAKPTPDFSQVTTSDEGMFATPDDYGTSYYYRGAVDNNWVEFAGFYWRIIRINGDGSVRMIYSGETKPTESEAVVMTGEGTTIGTSVFNESSNLAEYSGYMYQVGQQHGYVSSSTAKVAVDNWYLENIFNNNFHSYISDTLFCADRTAYTDKAGTTVASGIGTGTQYFESYINNITNKTPSLECIVKEDAFTVNDEVNGNANLGFPVALISVDEAVYSGMTEWEGSDYLYNKHYLYNSVDTITMSPSYKDSRFATLIRLYNGETLNSNGSVSETYYLRPVLSIKSDALAGGSGTWNDPYVVL